MSVAHLLLGLDVGDDLRAYAREWADQGIRPDDVRNAGDVLFVVNGTSVRCADSFQAAGAALLLRLLIVDERARRHHERTQGRRASAQE